MGFFRILIVCHINTYKLKVFIAYMEITTMGSFRIFDYVPYKY
jgi:hypothetical protein